MSKPFSFNKKRLLIILSLVSIVLLILPFLPIPEESQAGFGVFIGRFHPILVHFPVVLILLPLLMEGLKKWKNWAFIDQIMPLFMAMAVISTVFSAIAGFLLYGSGEYSGELIRNHLWAGIGVAVGMNLAWLVFEWKFEKAFLPILIIVNLMLIYTGHLGGSLTHGEEYLTEYLPKLNTPKAPIEQKPLEELNVFNDIVMAIFDAKCLSCHNDRKTKGKLNMASFEKLMMGGKSKKTMLDSIHPASGGLYNRIHLPDDHDDHMPPSGKPQLDETEKTLIYWWLTSGGKSDQLLGENQPDSVRRALDNYLPQVAVRQQEQIIQKEEREKLVKEMIPTMEKLGFVVEPDPEADSMLFALSMKLPPAKITNETLVELLPFAHAFSKISLVSAEITDDGLYTLGQMKALRHLVLAKTCIKGEGIPYLARLPRLEVLNLSETSVDDLAAFQLMDLPRLKQVYLFNSEVSANVIKALNDYLPEIEILNQEGKLY